MRFQQLFRFIAINFIFSAFYCYSAPQKPHEEWWTFNPDKFDMFNGWLGDYNARSRALSREHIIQQGYATVLDVPCGTCTEYFGYQKTNMAVDYTGLDITAYLVARAQSFGIKAHEGSIENIPFIDSSFDLVYIRHLLEHLDYYQKALSEAIRVAEKEVLVVFFIPPTSGRGDIISPAEVDGALLFHNNYNREALIWFINQNPKVKHLEWQAVDGPTTEEILHVYLKT